MDQHFTFLAFSSTMTKWMLFLKTAMHSSFQLTNDTDSCVTLTWDFHTDPLLRVKTWLDPTVGRRGTAMIRPEMFCWSGKPFTSTFRNHRVSRSGSGSPASALPQGRLLPFPTMCSGISSIPHIPLARSALHSQQSKLHHHWRISTQPKLIHIFKI